MNLQTIKVWPSGKEEVRDVTAYDLYDTAEACIQHCTKLFKGASHGYKVAEVRAVYDEKEQNFVPVIIGIDGKTYNHVEAAKYVHIE